MSRISIHYTREDLKKLILKDLQEKLPDARIELHQVKIETKSAQNYKSEWEQADFRAQFEISE